MDEPRIRYLAAFTLLGLVAAVPSIVLMEWFSNGAVGENGELSWLFDVVPPVCVGVCLWFGGLWAGWQSPARRWGALLLLLASASVSWTIARRVYIASPEASWGPMLAGAVGAFLLAVLLPWAWDLRRGSLLLPAAATVAGAAGLVVARGLETAMGDWMFVNDRWVCLMMLAWQATVFVTIAAVTTPAEAHDQTVRLQKNRIAM